MGPITDCGGQAGLGRRTGEVYSRMCGTKKSERKEEGVKESERVKESECVWDRALPAARVGQATCRRWKRCRHAVRRCGETEEAGSRVLPEAVRKLITSNRVAYPPALNACLARALAWAATFHAVSAISVCRRLTSMVALSSPSRDRMGFFRSTPALTAAAILTGSPSAMAAARGAPVVVRVGASGVCV